MTNVINRLSVFGMVLISIIGGFLFAGGIIWYMYQLGPTYTYHCNKQGGIVLENNDQICLDPVDNHVITVDTTRRDY